MIQFMGWTCVVLALIGTVLNIQKKKMGFGFWMISNFYWFFHNIRINEYAQSILYAVFFSLAVYGYLQWEEEDQEND